MSITTDHQEMLLSPADERLLRRVNWAVAWCATLLCISLGVVLVRQVPAGAWGAALLALLLGLPLATVLHEGTHALALRSLGYRVRLTCTSFYPPGWQPR